ncbi:MAG: hypothetical protein ACLU1W_08090 [Collinsella sp.]
MPKGEPELDDGGEDVESGLNALLGLERYLLPTLEISESADEETVSDIFVRVNSQGQALKQDDFIMTLLSVYEPAMRERIEEFCAMSHAPAKGTSYNPLMTVSPTHIIRATVGVGFKRVACVMPTRFFAGEISRQRKRRPRRGPRTLPRSVAPSISCST